MLKAKIIVVGHEPTFVDALKVILDDFGYDAITALSINEGLEKASRFQAALAITDTRFAAADSWYFLESLRRSCPCCSVILTGEYGTEDEAAREAAIQADAVLPKTFSPSTLIELTQAILSSKQASSYR